MKQENKSAEIKQEKNKFEQYLDDNGLRMSMGRKGVFDVAMSLHGHFSIEDVIAKCKADEKSPSRATIYRVIKELLEAGVIRETAFGDKHTNYEHLYDEKPHHHARCMRCGVFIELPDLHEDRLYRPILQKTGFQVVGHEMHFYGICKECR